jgi:hypothetical protein
MRREHIAFRDELVRYQERESSARRYPMQLPVNGTDRSETSSVHFAYAGSGRADKASTTAHAYSSGTIIEDPHRQKASARQAVIIPGASETAKVIPPHPSQRRPRTITSPAAIYYSQSPHSIHPASRGPAGGSFDTDTPRASTNHALIPVSAANAFIPISAVNVSTRDPTTDHIPPIAIPGFVPSSTTNTCITTPAATAYTRVPIPDSYRPARATGTHTPPASNTFISVARAAPSPTLRDEFGQPMRPPIRTLDPTEPTTGLMLYTDGSELVDITNGRTVEGAARALAIRAGEIETSETTWGHIQHALASRFNQSSTSLRSTNTADRMRPSTDNPGRHSSSTASASASLDGLDILGPPVHTTRPHSPRIPPRRSESPIPSSGSSVMTWGTMSTERDTALGDAGLAPGGLWDSNSQHTASRQSSFADLRLGRLPEPIAAGDSDDEYEDSSTPRSASDRVVSLWPGDAASTGSSVQGSLPSSGTIGIFTPSARLAEGSGQNSRASDPPVGLGRRTSVPSQQISAQEELNHVDRSLLALVAEARIQRRHASPLPLTSAAEGFTGLRSQSWEARSEQGEGPNARSAMQQRADPEPSGSGPSSGTHADRTPGPRETVSGSSRRRSNAPVVAPPMASSASFHSERNISRHSMVDEPESRPRTVSQEFCSQEFGGNSTAPSLLNGSSLLLTMSPPGPATSAATTSNGEPSSIRAPRPISGRFANIFALWDSRATE